jgi:hypothetical protein
LPIEPETVDAVVTDIPFGETWLCHVAEFSEWCAQVLKPNGVMVTWYSHSRLDRLLAALSTPRLRYQWLFVAPLASAKMVTGQWLNTRHQIAVVYTRSRRLELRAAVEDWVPMGRKGERMHKHQKNVPQMQHFAQGFSEEGGLVVDPFAGSFTTAEACWNTNRRFIGSDLNPDCLRMARERFKFLRSNG